MKVLELFLLDVSRGMCFEITNKVLFKHETNGTIGCHFYCDNCGFRKGEGDSLKILDQLPIKHEEIK